MTEINDMYSIVSTTRARYFGPVSSTKKGVEMESAYEIKGDKQEPKDIAQGYMRGQLVGDNRRVVLSDALVESITDAPDETRILNTYKALLPEAEKRAQGEATYAALEALLSR